MYQDHWKPSYVEINQKQNLVVKFSWKLIILRTFSELFQLMAEFEQNNIKSKLNQEFIFQ